jgi:hypothetical protein
MLPDHTLSLRFAFVIMDPYFITRYDSLQKNSLLHNEDVLSIPNKFEALLFVCLSEFSEPSTHIF